MSNFERVTTTRAPTRERPRARQRRRRRRLCHHGRDGHESLPRRGGHCFARELPSRRAFTRAPFREPYAPYATERHQCATRVWRAGHPHVAALRAKSALRISGVLRDRTWLGGACDPRTMCLDGSKSTQSHPKTHAPAPSSPAGRPASYSSSSSMPEIDNLLARHRWICAKTGYALKSKVLLTCLGCPWKMRCGFVTACVLLAARASSYKWAIDETSAAPSSGHSLFTHVGIEQGRGKRLAVSARVSKVARTTSVSVSLFRARTMHESLVGEGCSSASRPVAGTTRTNSPSPSGRQRTRRKQRANETQVLYVACATIRETACVAARLEKTRFLSLPERESWEITRDDVTQPTRCASPLETLFCFPARARRLYMYGSDAGFGLAPSEIFHFLEAVCFSRFQRKMETGPWPLTGGEAYVSLELAATIRGAGLG